MEINIDNVLKELAAENYSRITGSTAISREAVITALEESIAETQRFENDLMSLRTQISKLVDAFNELGHNGKITVYVDIDFDEE